MSRLGKKPVDVPKNVKVAINGSAVSIEGPKGTQSMTTGEGVDVAWDESARTISVSVDESKLDDRQLRAMWGTTRALLANMIVGVTQGYEKKLQIEGVGWTAALAGQNLNLKIGYANLIAVPVPQGLNVQVEKQLITVQGADKQAVGQFAATVRAKRKPEPYNGKGIRYVGEVIRKKEGKAFGK